MMCWSIIWLIYQHNYKKVVKNANWIFTVHQMLIFSNKWCQIDIGQCWVTSKSMWVCKLLFLDISANFVAKFQLYFYVPWQHVSSEWKISSPFSFWKIWTIFSTSTLWLINSICINVTFSPGQDKAHLSSDIFKCTFCNENGHILFHI